MIKNMKPLHFSGKVALQADYVFNHPDRITNFEDMGVEVCPVDINAGLVSSKVDKWGMDQGSQDAIEDNIQSRFGLETPGESY
jgi:hypothetical protein